jgi:hypothetical protein
MAKAKIRKCDQGTAFAVALQREAGQGSGRCDDAAAMAGFLDGNAQFLLGAGVSSRLLWEGAQHVGLTNLEMAHLIQLRPAVAIDLMWVETDKPVSPKLVAEVRGHLDGARKEANWAGSR